MRTLRITLVAVAILLLSPVAVEAGRSNIIFVYPGTPPKTVVIKTLGSTDMAAYFSDNLSYSFEIYKPGTKEELQNILKIFRKNPAVKVCEMGVTTGDYQQIILELKSKQDTKWFAGAFKKAGIVSVKYNNEPELTVDKL